MQTAKVSPAQEVIDKTSYYSEDGALNLKALIEFQDYEDMTLRQVIDSVKNDINKD